MNSLVLGLLIASVVVAILFIALSNGQKSLLSMSLKGIASFCFVFLAMGICLVDGLSVPRMFIVMGLVASLVGDIVLALPDMPEMNKKSSTITLIGGLCFAVAHVLYLTSMIIMFGFKWWVILIAIALGLIFFFGNKIIGKLDYGNLTYGMPFYATFVSLVVAESIMAFVSGANLIGSIMIFVGFVLFWLSDIVLMNIYFGKKPEKNVFRYYFNLGFYYSGQILIALSILFLI